MSSLPQSLASKIKSIPMDPLALANNVELAYMLSFSNYGLSNDTVQCSPKDSYNSPLQCYNFVDFDESTYDALYAETKKNYELKNSTVVKCIRNSFKDFFTRVSAMTYSAALKKDELLSAPSTSTIKIPVFDGEYKLDQMRGNNANEWPRNLKQFHEQVSKLPWNAFSAEPEFYFEDFFKSAYVALKNVIKKCSGAENRAEYVQQIQLIIQIVLMISFKTNNQTHMLTQLQTIRNLDIDKILTEKQIAEQIQKIQAYCLDAFQKLPPANEEQEYHAPKKLWEKGSAFMIMKKIHFQKQNGLAYFTVTNDGTYLYIYISSINGGMYKVGTGRNSSIAGKIYLQKEVLLPVGSKLDEVNWVFCQGKIYLKSGSREPNLIEVINPDTFKTEQVIELKCPSIFGHQSLVNLNRNSILLTDGQRLYYLGKQLKIKQSKEQKKQQEPKVIPEEDASKKKKSKKQKAQQPAAETQKSNPEQIDKVIQFVLFQFQFDQKEKEAECDEALAQELYLSFNNYFTIKECRRALDICENDLSDAAQWLFEQGEKERTTKTLYPSNRTIIAQSQITSNFAQKNLKGSNQIITKEGSILHTQNVHESIWTMDEDEITCYSEGGFKIFSKLQADSHPVHENSGLMTTHLKTLQAKIQRNPDFTISYDPVNRVFYTFTWPTDGGHYFPTAVLIGSDYKQTVELNYQKKISLSHSDPKNLAEFSKWILIRMNLLDSSHCIHLGRVNNWLWYYGQKIIQLNKDINGNNDLDKKKLTNKRAKLLTKMNRVNEYYEIYQKNKQEFEKTGKITQQIRVIPPYGSDGTCENLLKVRNIYGKQLNVEDVNDFIVCLEGWLSNRFKIMDTKTRKTLHEIRDQLLALKPKMNLTSVKKLNILLINNFFQFFDSPSQQLDFITSLDKTQIVLFVEKHHFSRYKTKKSLVYELKSKDCLVQKYESKTKCEQIFLSVSNVSLKDLYESMTIGNLMAEPSNSDRKKEKPALHKFLQKQIINGPNGTKLLQFIFLEAFRSIVKQRKFEEYAKELEKLFLDTFKIIEAVVGQANISLLKGLSDPFNQILQLYFASLCSFIPSISLVECLSKILDQLQKKQIVQLFSCIEDLQFEGISQTFQKIYETPHPIQRGKNQNFPPLKNPEASLIYAEFDKRCQSDPNHDNLSIQMIHENSPVGNSINCNDGVFTSNLRLTGKVDSGKPYLIMGNSVTIDFSSSGHAKDAKSFGRFGFKFGLRPIFAGKIKYKKQGLDKVEKVFGVKSEFQKYLNTLKLLTITISNSIENLINLEREEKQNLEVHRFLNGKIFRQGYQEEQNVIKPENDTNQLNLDHLFGEKSKFRLDSRVLLMKMLHADSLKKDTKNPQASVPAGKQETKSIWQLDGIPGYIKSYVDKIKNFSGDFIDVFLQTRNLALPKGIYATQLKKAGFTQDMKKLWLQGQAILFLTVLKHSGLLHLNIKFSIQYIKANLKAFQEARNGIYESFIRRMQSVRQWRDLLQTFEGKKDQIIEQEQKSEKISENSKVEKIAGIQIKKKGMATKTIKLENKSKNETKFEKKTSKKQEQDPNVLAEKRRKQAQKVIRERLTQEYMIKSLCSLKGIEFVPKQTYENVTRIINRLDQEIKLNKKETESVYIQPINHLIKSCIFLLKLKSPSTKQTILEEQNLEPEEMFRSYSQDQRHVNLNKVNVFREWLENWKKWKDFRKEGKVQLKFPVSEIIDFVNSWISLDKFKSEIHFRIKIAQNRTKFYQLNSNLLKSTANSFLNKYVIGSEVACIKGGYNAGLQSVSTNRMNDLLQKYRDYSACLKLQQQKKFKQLPLKLKQIQALIKSQSDNALQKIRLTSLHLYLIQSQNPNIDLNVALFFIPLKYLTSANQQLVFIVSLIVQRAYLSNHALEEIVEELYREVGQNSISCKRWRDLFFIQRMLFLLKKLEHKCRQKLEVPEKQKVAEVLFYLIYHLEIPLICRISFRILSLLKISLKRDINTPFQKTYKAITVNQKTIQIQQFKLQNTQSYNNLQLIAAKCFQVFKGEFRNEIRQKMLSPFKDINVEQAQKQESYTIILNMNQEEDIVWMTSVLYYLEEIEKTMVTIKDWEEYLTKKNKKKEHHKDKDNQNNNKDTGSQEIQVNEKKNQKKVTDQRILLDIPNEAFIINDEIQANLPVGWFFNYSNIFNDYLNKNFAPSPLNIQNAPNLAQKKGKNTNQAINPTTTRKQWNPVEFLKIYKKFEDLTSKPLQEPKEDEPEENKIQFIKAKNFIARIRKHTGEVSTIFSNLSQNGYYIFREDVPKEKCEIICQLFTLGGQSRLKPIPCDFKTKDYATKLSPAFVAPTKKSQLKITCIKSDQYKRFNDIINAPASVQAKVENNPLLYYTSLSNSEFLLEDKCHLPYEQLPEVDSNEDDIKIQFTKYFTESGFSRMKKRQDQVYLKQYPKLRYFIAQGGLQSGLQQCTLVPAFDSSLTCQKSTYNHIYPSLPKHETLQDTEELLQKTIKLMKGQFCEIKEKNHIIPYMLMSCYLEKLSATNLQFISVDLLKQFQEGLSKFVRGFKADISIEKYREKIQVLTTKMLDSENKNLSQFRLYRFDEQMIKDDLMNFVDLDKIKSSLKQEKAQSTHETIQSHQYPKSSYLLPIHTPIPEENKLLKYWEKNILPKIYDFVKSSLKQIQIDDFFEQMRIPLRKNDQLEAKKIAYVICDNKLPAGAVLPDSNHNWNSLTIEDVTVGQDVLLRLSKSKHESFSPLMYSQSQEHRVGQVLFIDQKNFSALVRHRLPEYSIFVYSWVPINSLQSVQESLAHYSTQTIYKQLQSSLKGIIYNYSKICMTSLSKRVKINMESLLEETIVDIFRDNPISGWNQNKNWPLKQVFKSQLAEGNTHAVSFVENKFAPFQSYDIDLFSESILNLNKFENSLGLIVSFKKTASLIWYSGIRFYSDEYGFKQIANTYASKCCVNELQPLQFKNPNVYCKYYTNKQFLKAFDQGKYEQKQIGATVFAVDPSWTVSTYICNVVGEIAIEENKYEDYLGRFNKVFLKWLEKRQAIYLSNQLCRVITKNTLRIRRILTNKQKPITFEAVGTSEQQIKSFLQWVNILKESEDKDMLVLYSPLLQDLIETIASLLSGLDKVTLALPPQVQQMIKMIQMTTEIENNLKGKRTKKYPTNNDTQWERILVIENIPEYTNEKELREKIKAILMKNNGKILAPSFDIFYSAGQLVILVDSWDITELVEEEVMEKIQHEEEKEPEPENADQGLLMQWSCQVCTFLNQAGVPTCGICDAPAPAPKAEIVYEKIESKDVNETELKLREKQMKRFQNVKEEIKAYIAESWKSQCSRIDSLKEKEQKLKEERRKKKGKNAEVQQKTFEKPAQPTIILSSGSTVLDKKIVEQFLRKRYEKLPESITKKINSEQFNTFLSKFKELTKLGYDLWGDNITNEAPTLLNFQYLSELMQYVQDEICKGSSSVLSYNQASIRMINQIPLLRDEQEDPLNFSAENNIGVKTKYKRLAEQKSYNIRYSWKIIKELNLSASKCLPFINMKLIPNEEGKAICSINTIGSNLKCLRQLIMGALKLELFQKIMQRTSVVLEAQDIPKINLQRLKVKDDGNRTSKLISSKDKDDFLFTKSHEQLQKISSINLRPFKPKGTEPYLSFIVNFKGEMVQGEAGPYRQFFTDISNELAPEAGLNLFIKTPNNAHKTGEGRSKWTINPKANSTYYLSLYNFLGRLMGCCIRTGCHLPIDLANFCWKLIADEKIKQADIDQLDRQFYEQNKQLIQCPSQSTFDYMEQAVGQPVSWVYTTIDGEEQDLIPNGRSERVSYHDRIKYVEMMEKRRIDEISLQVTKIREGLNQMISDPFLNHISGEELKTMICGVPKVDVQLLRKHTKYAGGLNEESPVIKYFWQMMKEINEEQRLKVIRFCWGQQRLPLNSEQFERNGVRFMIKPMLNKQNPDQALPKADTCFFNIELPQYSTKQIMKQRILLAVNLDNVSINGDRNIQPDDNPLMGNVDYEDEGEEEEDEEGGGGGGGEEE